VTPGPGHRKCTAYLWPGPGGAPLALPLTEGLGVTAGAETVVSSFTCCDEDIASLALMSKTLEPRSME